MARAYKYVKQHKAVLLSDKFPFAKGKWFIFDTLDSLILSFQLSKGR